MLSRSIGLLDERIESVTACQSLARGVAVVVFANRMIAGNDTSATNAAETAIGKPTRTKVKTIPTMMFPASKISEALPQTIPASGPTEASSSVILATRNTTIPSRSFAVPAGLFSTPGASLSRRLYVHHEYHALESWRVRLIGPAAMTVRPHPAATTTNRSGANRGNTNAAPNGMTSSDEKIVSSSHSKRSFAAVLRSNGKLVAR